MHNAEQEIVRLQSIIDSVGIIHPGTIKQLDMMGQNNKFEDRGLEKLARSRASYTGNTDNDNKKNNASTNAAGTTNATTDSVPGVEAPQMGTSNVLATAPPLQKGTSAKEDKKDKKDQEQTETETKSQNESQTKENNTSTIPSTIPPTIPTTTSAPSVSTISALPPSDAPIDSVWVKPSDASLILRARSIHEILLEHPELQKEEDEKIQMNAETRAWNERKLERLARKQKKEQNNMKAKKTRSKTTNHALKFASRLESTENIEVDLNNTTNNTTNNTNESSDGENNSNNTSTPITKANSEGNHGSVTTNAATSASTTSTTSTTPSPPTMQNNEDYDDSVELLRLRGMLSFLLYSDHDSLDKVKNLIVGGKSNVEFELPAEIIKDEEDQEIDQRRNNLRRLGRSGNWSSFVEDLTARFPLRHPVNLDAQDRLLIRIGDAKVRRNRNENVKRDPYNILASKVGDTGGILEGLGRK